MEHRFSRIRSVHIYEAEFICIFLCVYGLARTLRVTVKTFCTRVPILRHAIDLAAAAIATSTGEIPRTGDISNTFVKQPGLHSRVSLHNEYRVTDHLKSLVYVSRCVSSILKSLIISKQSVI